MAKLCLLNLQKGARWLERKPFWRSEGSRGSRRRRWVTGLEGGLAMLKYGELAVLSFPMSCYRKMRG